MSFKVQLASVVVVGTLLGFGRPALVSALPYGNCEDVQASWDWADLETCGPYYYEGDPYIADSLTSTALDYVQTYNWGSYVYLYWFGRVSPDTDPGYYSAGFMVD